jgi:DNA polymerase-3 subunit beta
MLLKADADGTLTISAFDYEISARVTVAADVLEPGEVLVSGKLLAAIASALPSGAVRIDVDGTKVAIKAGSASYALQVMPIEQYPTLPSLPEVAGTIENEAFKTMVNKVSVAASAREDANPVFAGVRFKVNDDKINLTATDRYRLAHLDGTWEATKPGLETSLLVKAKVFQDVAKSLGATGEDISIGLNTDGGLELIGFSSGGKQTTAQLIDGQLPNIEAIFPEQQPIYAVLSRTALIDAVKRVKLVSDGIIKISFVQGEVEIKAGQGEDAQASEILPAELVGEDIAFAVKPEYLLDGLTAISDNFVRLSFTGPVKPVEISGQETLTGERDYNYRHFVVPYRLP